jgi:hypothetical protein
VSKCKVNDGIVVGKEYGEEDILSQAWMKSNQRLGSEESVDWTYNGRVSKNGDILQHHTRL